MSEKTIVILGAGAGGIVCANKLAAKLRGNYKIIVVEKEAQHAFVPSFLWLMGTVGMMK